MTHTDWYVHTCQHMNMYKKCTHAKGCNNITQRLGDVTYKGNMQN